MGDKTRDANLREAASTAYGLLWAMKVDTTKPDGLRLSLARAQLLHTLSNDERKTGIDRARSLIETPNAKVSGAGTASAGLPG